MKRQSISLWLLFIGILGILSWSCEGSGTQYGNILPVARLANIPPPDRTTNLKNPRLTLYWVGDDADGFVTAFKYRWSYTITENNHTDTLQKSWKTLLNIMWGSGPQALALMIDTVYQNSEMYTTKVYKYFANLDPRAAGTNQGLPTDIADGLVRGDTVMIEGVRVYASNPDSIIDQSTIDPTSPDPIIRRGLRMVKRYPDHVNPNSGTFIFDSQDSLNNHVFQITAIDNLGAVGPEARVKFNTFRVPPPVDSVNMNTRDTLYILDKVTDSFTGIHVTFWGNDPNSRTIEYQWVCDKDEWPGEAPWSKWSERTYADITAKDLPNPYKIKHVFYLRARNEFGSINTLGYFTTAGAPDSNNNPTWDTTWSKKTFYTLYPEFAKPGYTKRVLLLNHAFEYSAADADEEHPTYPTLINFWKSIMNDAGMQGKYDYWSTTKDTFPTFQMLSKYSTIVFFADVVSPEKKWFKGVPTSDRDTNTALIGNKSNMLISYCRIGGNIIWSAANFGLTINVGINVHNLLLHGELGVQLDTSARGFVGANAYSLIPVDGYPNVEVDQTKLLPASNGVLANTVLTYRAARLGMGERFYSYVDKNAASTLNGTNIGIRYNGSTYKSIYFGFPLYYINYSQAVTILQTALKDVGEK